MVFKGISIGAYDLETIMTPHSLSPVIITGYPFRSQIQTPAKPPEYQFDHQIMKMLVDFICFVLWAQESFFQSVKSFAITSGPILWFLHFGITSRQ